MKRALFLDRDGTLVEPRHYPSCPEDLVLSPEIGPLLRMFQTSGWELVVVTNQSGIARGLLSEEDYARVQARMVELLATDGARVDASYMCPHHPDFGSPCECRKPGTLLFRRAAVEHDLDLRQSVFIGDRWRDVAPAKAFGGRGVLVDGDATPADDRRQATDESMDVVGSLEEAAKLVTGG